MGRYGRRRRVLKTVQCSKHLLVTFYLLVRVSQPNQGVQNQLLSDFTLSWVVFNEINVVVCRHLMRYNTKFKKRRMTRLPCRI